MQQTERERADQPPIEGWKKDEHLAALKTIREMEVKVSRSLPLVICQDGLFLS